MVVNRVLKYVFTVPVMDGSYQRSRGWFFCKLMVPCRLHDACPLHQTLVTGLWKIQKGLYKQRVEVWWGVRAKRNNCQHVSPTSNYATLRLCVCIQIHANELHAYVYLCMQLCIIHVYVCFWEQLRESVCVCEGRCVSVSASCVCMTAINVVRGRWQRRVMDRLCAAGWVSGEGHCYILPGRDNLE